MPIILVILTITLASISTYLFLQSKNSDLSQSRLNKDEAIRIAKELAAADIEKAKDKVIKIESTLKALKSEGNSGTKARQDFVNERILTLTEKESLIGNKQEILDSRKRDVNTINKTIDESRVQLKSRLYQAARIDRSGMENKLKQDFTVDLSEYEAKLEKSKLQLLQSSSEKLASDIIDEVIALGMVEYFTENTNANIDLLSRKQGEILVGNDEENIRKLEELTNTQIKVDMEKEYINISSLDPIRREVAVRVTHQLLKDKNPTPKRVEDIVRAEKSKLLQEVKQTGNEVARITNLLNLPEELKTILGKCKYRYSYGQNLLRHNLEVVRIGESLAYKLGADIEITKLACLLHDIGKMEPIEGKSHHHISAEITQKYYKSEKLFNAIIAHHFDIDSNCLEADIVRIADAMSGSRPGARRNSTEEYFEKIKALEEIAISSEGVNEAYAIQAGREVRIIVNPRKITDKQAAELAAKVAREIEEKLSYPGQIKVNVVREIQESMMAESQMQNQNSKIPAKR